MGKWEPAYRLELKYKALLRPLLLKISKVVSEASTLEEVLKSLDKLARSKEFKNWSTHVAATTTKDILQGTKISWFSSKYRGGEVAELLQKELSGNLGKEYSAILRSNASMISSIPDYLKEHTATRISTLTTEGYRPESIMEDMASYLPDLTKSRLKLISRTETSKTASAITELRCNRLNIKGYLWRSTRDGRTRPGHYVMKDVFVLWSHPPEPEVLVGEKSQGKYHAGCIYNCRCYSKPVLSLDELVFPQKVYYNGSIVLMSRPQLEKLLA